MNILLEPAPEVPPTLVICARCSHAKPPSEFYVKNKRPGAYGYNQPTSDCKVCARQKRKTWRDANRELVNQRMVGYRLRSSFGISLDEYDAMLTAQGGGCAICGKTAPASADEGKRLAVDHDHATGAVRGLLCYQPCNPALGYFDDDPDLLDRVAAYLERGAA